MAKNRYKPSRTSSGFRPIGQGLQASRRELQDQAQIKIDALRLAKEQHREATNINISGLTSKHRFEQGVQKEKQVLENAVRNRQYEALSIKADRDVDRLKGEAKQAEEYAEFVATYGAFAPKSIANYQKLAQAGLGIADRLHGNELIKQAMKEDKFSTPLKLTDEARLKLEKRWGKDFYKLIKNGEIDLAKFLYEDGIKGSRNERYGRWVWDQINAKGSGEYQSVRTFVGTLGTKERPWGVNAKNADELYEFAAFERLRQLGISPTSKYGQKVIQKYQSWGRLAAMNAANRQNAEQTTIDLNKAIEEDIIPLKGQIGTDAKIDLNDKFNKTIGRASIGTWSDGKGGFIVGGDAGLGGSFEYVGIQLVQQYPERFRTQEDVEAFFADLYVPDDKAEDGFSTTETWGSKHPTRVEAIIKAWNTASDAAEQKGKQKQRGEYNRLTVDIKNQIKERNDNPDDPNRLNDKDFKFKLIKTIESSDISDAQKTTLYRNNELLEQGFNAKYDDKFVQIYNLLETGTDNDWDLAVQIYNGLDAAGRDSIRPQFEVFNNLGDMYHNGKRGIKAEGEKTLTFFKKSQSAPNSGSNTTTLDSSAYFAMAEFDSEVIRIGNELINAPDQGKEGNKYKNNKNLAFIDARKIVEQEYADGAPEHEGTEKWINSRFQRTSKTIGTGQDFTGKGWVYTKFTSSNGQTAARIEEFRTLSNDGTLKNLDAELKNADLVEIETSKLDNAIVHLNYPLEDLLEKNPEIVISPKNVGSLAKYLEKERERIALEASGLNRKGSIFSDLNITKKDDLGDIIGARAFNNTLRLEKLNAQYKPDGRTPKTQTDYLNDALKDNGYDIRIPPDLNDQALLQNGVIIKKSNQRGLFNWNGAKVQFILPMKPEVREYLNGKTIQQIFKDDNGVDFQPAPEGSENAGTIVISNPRKFFDNGGVKVLIRDGTPVNVLQTFGIIPPTTDTSKLPTKGELKDFLSPKEYRQKLDAERKARRKKLKDLDTVPWYTLGGGL